MWEQLRAQISTHTPLAGRDERILLARSFKQQFLLTRPLRGATLNPAFTRLWKRISTHTPLAGRDLTTISNDANAWDFYSHAPCGARHRCDAKRMG